MPVIVSPNMNLQIPVVGVEPGPNYAQDVNTSLLTIDQHNHAFGNGVQITPTGLNINTDLTIQNNNLISLRSVRFSPQVAPIPAMSPDLGCIYESGVDLYYNDGLGNQIRITASGGVAGSPGSIANLTSPASASYNAGTETFVWESNTNTAANMDMGSIILRDITANSHGVTINPPPALASDYSLTLPPALPSSVTFLTVDSSGNIGDTTSSYPIDNSSLVVVGGLLEVGTIQQSNLAAPNILVSASCGNFTSSANGFVPINNLSLTITTSGKPVYVSFQPDGAAFPAASLVTMTTPGNGNFLLLRNGTQVASSAFTLQDPNVLTPNLNFIDYSLTAGTYTYEMTVSVQVGSTIAINNTVMVVREM